ncbi:MAG TPA: SMP-30/gluconolactonase/LRE family protein [Croceibacterium sp.]
MLGEGPVWVGDAVWFVDIKRHKVHRFDPVARAHRAFEAPDQVGWVLPAEGGGMIAGIRTGLHRFDPANGVFALLYDPEPQHPGNRLNDATTDVHGRLWFGSMDDGESQLTGYLYRCAGGQCTDSGLPPVAITNGPAFSADGTVLYHTDTLGRVIYRAPVNDDGSLGAPVPFVTIEDGAGYPDGPVVDAEGCLWTGLYAGWSVRRYDPAGKLIETVRLPTANVTKMCFGGPDLKTAYVTSARKNLDAAALAAQPEAGNLFAFEPGVAGLPVTPAKIAGLG